MKDWFRHDCDAYFDEKMVELRSEFGLEGYGFFFAVVERLRSAKNNRLKNDAGLIAIQLGLDRTNVQQMLNKCLDACLFESDEDHIFSPSLNGRVEQYKRTVEARREAGKASGKARRSRGVRTNVQQMLNKAIEQSPNNALDPLILDLKDQSTDLSIDLKISRTTYAPRILLTEAEHAALCQQFGAELVSEQISVASDWSLSKGKTHKDCAAFMRNWLRRAGASQRLGSRNSQPQLSRGMQTKILEHQMADEWARRKTEEQAQQHRAALRLEVKR